MSKSSLQIQKEIATRLNIKEKKLLRLLNSSRLSRADWERVNWVYEQKQHHSFFATLALPLFAGLGVMALLFRQSTRRFQLVCVAAVATALHFPMKQRVEVLFLRQVSPYFEKYDIK